ncbi:MAG TPA: hypothetical protein VI300_08635, partial [Solirubrobacter sp.]
PEAAAITREFMSKRLMEPLVRELGSDRPALRADLVAAHLMGLGIARYVLGLEALAATPSETVVATVAPTLQHYLTGELPAG